MGNPEKMVHKSSI